MALVPVTVNFRSEDVDEILEALEYQTQILDSQTGQMVPNPETKMQFAKRFIRGTITARVLSMRERKAREAGEAAVNKVVDIT